MRNSALEAQLAAKSLKSINVSGDGNCFFRALSISLYGDESAHAQMRTSIAQHFADFGNVIFTSAGIALSDSASITKAADAIRQPCAWAGKDIALVAADLLQRDILVYIASESVLPLFYSPIRHRLPEQPIRLAFYEPGHYCALAQSSSTARYRHLQLPKSSSASPADASHAESASASAPSGDISLASAVTSASSGGLLVMSEATSSSLGSTPIVPVDTRQTGNGVTPAYWVETITSCRYYILTLDQCLKSSLKCRQISLTISLLSCVYQKHGSCQWTLSTCTI